MAMVFEREAELEFRNPVIVIWSVPNFVESNLKSSLVMPSACVALACAPFKVRWKDECLFQILILNR